MLESHGRASVSYTLTLAPAVSSSMISTENAITATVSGDQIDKVLAVLARDENS